MNKFEMPEYRHPDFSQEMFVNAPSVKYEAAEKDALRRRIFTAHPCIQNILK